MRDALLFLIVFGSLPFILMRPVVGVLMFAWLSLMNPHRLTYGAAFDFQFAALVAVVTLIGVLASKEPKKLPRSHVTVFIGLLLVWGTFTCLFALVPQLAWKEWNRVTKTLVMVLLTIAVVRNEKDIKALVWVVALSLGFYGLKGGIFTLLGGGGNRVHGPSGTYIGDNNAIALALVTAMPLLWYLQSQVQRLWMRLGLIGVALCTVAAAIGTYSRGALLGGSAMLFFLWLKSRRKLPGALFLLMLAPLTYNFMPEKWFNRMETIQDYANDGSAQGRINAWHFALNVATERPIGGGFSVFTPNMFVIYAPDPLDHHAAHSIYFQVLGEHGFFGLFLFLALMFTAWRTGSRILKSTRGVAAFKWAHDLAAMCQVAIIGYAVSGAFLSLAYYDLYYYIIAILVILERWVAAQGLHAVPVRGKMARPGDVLRVRNGLNGRTG